MRLSSLIIALCAASLLACGGAATPAASTADAAADVPVAAPVWTNAPAGAQTIGQGQTRQFPLTLSAADVTATVAQVDGVEAAVTADGQALEVHAGYGAATSASVQLHLATPAGGSATVSVALTVAPIAWKSALEWTTDGPEAREHGTLILDETADRLLLIDGSGYNPYGTPLSDVWALDLATGTWTQLQPTGDVPAAAASRRVARIPGKPLAYFFGGYVANGAGVKDLYRVDFSTPQPVFTKLKFTGGPTARSLHAFAYDAVTDRFFCFGGVDSAPRNDLWTMTLAGDTPTWTKLTTINKPSPRYGFFTGVDTVGGRLIVYSGAQGTATINAAQDTWVLDMRADAPDWLLVAQGDADNVPPGRRNGCAVWDPSGPRLLVFGGTADAKTSQPGLFAFDARPGHAAWTQLTLDNEPAVRSSGIGIYDPKRGQNLLGFGNTATGTFQDFQTLGY